MIRKGIIVVMMFAAFGTAVIYLISPSLSSLRFPPQTPLDLIAYTSDTGGLIVSVQGNYFRAVFLSFNKPDSPLRYETYLSVQRFQCKKIDMRVGCMWWIEFPFWFPFLIFVSYPTIAFIRGPLRRYHRRRKGLCVKCGYNLTGNTTGICSECGAEIQS